MLAEERHNAIVAQVNRNGSVLVKELSKQFGVTEDSIRKDLTLLEKRGLLKKTYGGAMRLRITSKQLAVSHDKPENMEEKKTIAGKAFDLIQSGSVIYLDISSSNIELARLLAESDKRVTIVTNSFDVVHATDIPCNLTVYFLGGQATEKRNGVMGALTNEQIGNYQFDQAFMGVGGIDLESGKVSTHLPDDGCTKAAAMESSTRKYMMLETKKFETLDVYSYAKIRDFTGAIMEKEPQEEIIKQLRDYSIDWI